MAKGQEYNWERKFLRDEQTGVEIVQLTGFPTISHALYFHCPSFTTDSKTLVFLSYPELRRDATPDIFRVDVDGTNLVQLTDTRGINSVVMAPDGRMAFYLVGGELHCVDINTCEEKTIGRIEGVTEWVTNPYRIYLSNTGSISADGQWYITSRQMTDGCKVILRYRTDGSEAGILYEHPDFPSHVQYEPSESKRITFCSAPDAEGRNIWTLNDDGTDLRLLNIKGSTGHFMWMGNPSQLRSEQPSLRMNSKRILSTLVPPHWALVSCTEDEPEPAVIARGKNFWHAAVSPDGEWIISDTNWPDEGLQLVQVRTGKYKTLCYPHSSQGHPQWTHPHPFFSPDGRMVVFNSDRTGICQVYLAKITEEFFRSFDDE